jgi:hypothetical protein
MKPTLAETPAARRIQPFYPSRRETLAGMPAFKGAEARRISEAVIDPCLLIKYTVFLIDSRISRNPGTMVMGTVCTFLELADWCAMKGYDLVKCGESPELALPHERTELT